MKHSDYALTLANMIRREDIPKKRSKLMQKLNLSYGFNYEEMESMSLAELFDHEFEQRQIMENEQQPLHEE